MVEISLKEKESIIEQFPLVHIVRTMKQDSNRHHYYMVEETGPMRLLHSIRGDEPERDRRWNNKRKGDRYRSDTKTR